MCPSAALCVPGERRCRSTGAVETDPPGFKFGAVGLRFLVGCSLGKKAFIETPIEYTATVWY